MEVVLSQNYSADIICREEIETSMRCASPGEIAETRLQGVRGATRVDVVVQLSRIVATNSLQREPRRLPLRDPPSL